MTNLLSAIVASARRSAWEREKRSRHATERDAAMRTPRGAEFRARLSAPGIQVIAECKRRSPSRGVLRHPYDPAAIAESYAAAGAAAISVLTEGSFFDGELKDLTDVREAVTIPVLRKDFISTEFQILEARAAGADAVLIIVGALDDQTLRQLLTTARDAGLAALVEVHTRDEEQRALGAGATIVGINSRNLRTLEVDLHVLDELILGIPGDVTAVAESGIRTGDDLRRLRAAGYDAFLIGERFMTERDPGQALEAIRKAATAEFEELR